MCPVVNGSYSIWAVYLWSEIEREWGAWHHGISWGFLEIMDQTGSREIPLCSLCVCVWVCVCVCERESVCVVTCTSVCEGEYILCMHCMSVFDVYITEGVCVCVCVYVCACARMFVSSYCSWPPPPPTHTHHCHAWMVYTPPNWLGLID